MNIHDPAYFLWVQGKSQRSKHKDQIISHFLSLFKRMGKEIDIIKKGKIRTLNILEIKVFAKAGAKILLETIKGKVIAFPGS